MEVLTALVSEKWLLAAAMFLWAWLERQERREDKLAVREERRVLTERLEAMALALGAIRDRIK